MLLDKVASAPPERTRPSARKKAAKRGVGAQNSAWEADFRPIAA